MAETDPLTALGCLHPDCEEVVRYFEESKVYAVQIESCLACPQGCLYCYASADDPPCTELLAERIISLLDEAASMGIRAVDWLGGDPLQRADWFRLMDAARERGLLNNVWTSGIPLRDRTVAEQVVDVSEGGFVSVHLDSLDEQVYGILHAGNPAENIRAIREGVAHLLGAGKPADEVINCITFTRPVAGRDVERTIRYFSEMGIRTCLTQICMAGLGADHPEWIPSPEEIRHACEVRDRINYPRSALSMSTMDVNKFYCGGAVCVTVEGDVTPCSVIRKGFGNIHEAPFQTVVERHREELVFAPLREGHLPGGCGTCKNQAVCWGCRATAFYTFGDMMREDPNCPYRQEDD